jgi:hypothetical protein
MTTAVPAGMKDGLMITSVSNGNIEVALVSKRRARGSYEIDPHHVGELLAQLIQITMIAHQRTGRALRSNVDRVTTWPIAVVSRVGLGPCELPDHECLMVRFGESHIGFPLRRAELRELGQAMIALSTDSERAN